VRNYFLFQIFGQGLRVSDLITLRWDNIIEGRIEFVQLKTKKRHSVILSDVLLNILKDYIPGKCSDLFEEIYSFSFEGKEYKMNYPDLKDYYKKISKEGLQKFLQGKDPKTTDFVELWKNQLDEIWFIVKSKLLIRITQYSRKNKSLFIFPILRNEDFKDLVFDNQTNLSQYQYNQLSSRTTVYNKQLKKLQEKCELNVVLTSHISRHTYTNILIDFTGNDIYSISKSLGHQRLSTTEHYIHQFTTERTDKVNNELNELFNFQ
jgi:integrase